MSRLGKEPALKIFHEKNFNSLVRMHSEELDSPRYQYESVERLEHTHSTDKHVPSSISSDDRRCMHNLTVASFEESASKILERQCVHNVYSQMSGEFGRLEHYQIWPNVQRFLSLFCTGSLIADIGCGNGKYLGMTNNTLVLGSDFCVELAEIAYAGGRNEVLVCDGLCVPYRDAIFDGVISIGVLHHIASVQRRRRVVQELCRILRPGGKLMISVWAFEQKHRKFISQDVLIPWSDKKSRGRFHVSGDESLNHPRVKNQVGNTCNFREYDLNGRRVPQVKEAKEIDGTGPTASLRPGKLSFAGLRSLLPTSMLFRVLNSNGKLQRSSRCTDDTLENTSHHQHAEKSRYRFAIREFPQSSLPQRCSECDQLSLHSAKNLSAPDIDACCVELKLCSASKTSEKVANKSELHIKNPNTESLSVIDTELSVNHLIEETVSNVSNHCSDETGISLYDKTTVSQQSCSEDYSNHRCDNHCAVIRNIGLSSTFDGSVAMSDNLDSTVSDQSFIRSDDNGPGANGVATVANHLKPTETIKRTKLTNPAESTEPSSQPNSAKGGEGIKTVGLLDGDKSADQYLRYYHLFKEGELYELINDYVPDLCSLRVSYEHSNWCLIAVKK